MVIIIKCLYFFDLTSLKIFRLYFGRNDDLINLLWDLVTFRCSRLIFNKHYFIEPWLANWLDAYLLEPNAFQKMPTDKVTFWSGELKPQLNDDEGLHITQNKHKKLSLFWNFKNSSNFENGNFLHQVLA